MANILTEWSSEHGQTTKIGQADGCEGETFQTAVQFGYDRHECEGYLGNVLGGVYRGNFA